MGYRIWVRSSAQVVDCVGYKGDRVVSLPSLSLVDDAGRDPVPVGP